MENIESLINNIIYTFLRNNDEWNTLILLIENNEYNKILSYCLNNYAKIILKDNNYRINEIIILRKYFNENKKESLKLILSTTQKIYSQKQKNK